jgi:hypothetical protein
MFRISKNGQEAVANVASYRQIVPAIRKAGAGRYQVDQLNDCVLGFEHASRPWALVTNKPNGEIVIEYEPPVI